MNSWDWYRSAPKKPPPAHGIKMKKAGSTWWGQRWIEALENVLRVDAGRLARGRSYARGGRTHDLVLKGGKVTAKVTGSQRKPYDITFHLAGIDEGKWKKAIAGMAAKAQFSAELLAGQMPKEIDLVFRDAGASLFPQSRSDLKTNCSCPDNGDPCKHVAATHYVLGEALDRDPFLLFELRGKTKTEVLDALRAARGGRKEKAFSKTDAFADEILSVKLDAMTMSEYDKARAPLPSLHFSFDDPAHSGAFLRQLGAPGAWNGVASPADVFGPAIRAAAEKARRMAMAEVVETDENVTDAVPAKKARYGTKQRGV